MYDGIDPADFITLPSYINYCYRALAMPENSMAIIPPNGYTTTGRRNQSASAICWLEHQSVVNKTPIMHARNSNEVKIGPYYIDGFAKSESGPDKVWEFDGCVSAWHWLNIILNYIFQYFHGCPRCASNRDSQHKEKMAEKYKETMKKHQFIKDKGFELITIWECDFRAEIKANAELRDFVLPLKARLKKYTNLRPRSTLRGGRTNNTRKSYTPRKGEILEYLDFTWVFLCTCKHK